MRNYDLLSIKLDNKIGKLTPIKFLNKNDSRNRRVWLFKCDCGNETEATASDVRLGRVQSCGCLSKEHIKKVSIGNILPNKQGVKNKLITRYIKEGQKRGYSFNLTNEEFFSLVFGNCYYCKQEPSNCMYNTVDKNPNYMIIYNGIDRLDNHIGYTKENCVTCCYICNKMKLNLDSDVFLKQIEKIYLNHRR